MDFPQQGRHLLLAVQALHQRGYELTRVAPGFADSPGGKVWQCQIVPAKCISKQHGAITDLDCDWDGSYFYSSRGWRAWQHQPPFLSESVEDAADFLLSSCKSLRDFGRGSDPEYVQWYGQMIEATKPAGFVVLENWCAEPPLDHMTALNVDSGGVIPLPPLPIA